VRLCPQLRRLSAEHARWLADIERRAAGDGADRAARLLALWEAQILPHCRAEEDVLLPELARRLSEADATVVFTLADHVALRRLARELRDAGGAERDTALGALELKIAEHASFEERTLFPVLQETLGCDRLAVLASEIAKQEPKQPVAGPPAANEVGKKGTRP
jgi:hemerythrin-like domain-containing protein